MAFVLYVNKMLDNEIHVSYTVAYEQTARRQAHSNPPHAGRGSVYALNLARGGSVDQHSHEAAC